MRIGIFGGDTAGRSIDSVVGDAHRAATDGFASYTLPQIFGLDAMGVLAVVGREVPDIRLATGVVPTYGRHPLTMAQQALTVQSTSGGRFVLGIGLFGMAALARRDLAWRDIGLIVGPQLAVLACFVPQLLSAAGPSDHALWILTRFHAPVHYGPDRLVGWIKEVAAWQLGAFAALHLLEASRPLRALWRFSLVASGIVIV